MYIDHIRTFTFYKAKSTLLTYIMFVLGYPYIYLLMICSVCRSESISGSNTFNGPYNNGPAKDKNP